MEIQNAIMVVEDEVTRARGIVLEATPLYSTDERLFEIARLADDPKALRFTLPIDQVEGLFNQLAARAEGRPSSQVGVPDDPRLAATLLILREFMHHLHFEAINLR